LPSRAPAIAVAVVLAYQWNVRIDRGSTIALVAIGVYPMWGPTFLPDMVMRLNWIGTILAMYLPGAVIVAAGLLQLRLSPDERRDRRHGRGAATS